MPEPTTATTTQPTTTAQLLQEFANEWVHLAALTYDDDTQESQWQTGSTPAPRHDTSERQKNNVADPVWSAVSDERRLKLRAAVVQAESTLARATAALKVTHTRLQAALDAHTG